MGETVDSLRAAAANLRKYHAETLPRMPQKAVIAALADLGSLWRDTAYPLRRETENWREPYPFAMVQVSLDALLSSLTPEKLKELLRDEDVPEAQGYPLIGHVIAGNTPLLAWVSIIRSLLVRSASLVKLPSNASAQWAFVFLRSLKEVAPALAECVYLAQWPGGTLKLDAALCAEADLVMAHGSDNTLHDLLALCPMETPFVGYGHRLSFGILLPNADRESAAQGFAKDILLFDQGGCLSPQTIYVQGGWSDTQQFAELLAKALTQQSSRFPLPIRSERAAATVRDARTLAWMEEGNSLWADPELRWTVIARPYSAFAASPTFGLVSVQPLASLQDLPEAVGAVATRLQGCAVAGEPSGGYLPGVSYLCRPGELQSPPLSWRQDGRDVLRVLLPSNKQRSAH